ncbi:MAG: carboxyl-terminal protease [Bacteroidota bacterium]|nr:carboxyl-terminal protease [Bacteroidota bacterium]
MNNNKAFYPLIFSIILASGIYLGYKIQGRNAAKQKVFYNSATSSKLDYILRLIDAKYVDTVDEQKLYDDAIGRMLEDLDPHSVYLPPSMMSHEAEIMEGNFEGIGIEFSIVKDTIQVITPISGGPSEQAGVSAGDKIIKINDTLVAGIKITNEMVMKKLKGPKGSKVTVMMLKNGSKKLLSYTIKRDKIPLYSVDAGFMLDNQTGYIKINRFSKTTYDEFMVRLDTLTHKGMKKLILDLRQNPGGFMEQATAIADEFLDDNKTIVYTEGRTMPRTYDKARAAGLFEEGKLAVLIDEGSASASEIVSGAIQDWDRGVIIGRRSFGKGLVQQEYELGDGSSVRLTVAKYFTPSGRSIQRPYEANVNDYYEDISKRYTTGEIFNADSIRQNKKETFKTLIKGRTVYGGGGITPDIFIPLDTSMYNPFVSEVYGLSLLQEFAYNYFNDNKSAFTKYSNVEQFNKDFNIDAALYKQFTDYCFANGVKRQDASYTVKSEVFLSSKLKAYFARQLWKLDGFYRVAADDDKMIQRALIEFKK